MCYQCALNGGNKILAAHFAFLAHRNGVSIDRLAQIADESSTGGGASAAEDAAMALAQACRCPYLSERVGLTTCQLNFLKRISIYACSSR